jgi:hypothetical protein
MLGISVFLGRFQKYKHAFVKVIQEKGALKTLPFFRRKPVIME